MPSYTQSEPKSGNAFFVEPGTYQVEVTKATEKVSQNGDPMISMTCEIRLANGAVGPTVWDNLVFTKKAAWKIDQFLASIGRAVVPGEEVIVEADDIVGMSGVAVIGEEPGTTNPSRRFNTLERWVFGAEKDDFTRAAKVKRLASPPAKSPAPLGRTTDDEGNDLEF